MAGRVEEHPDIVLRLVASDRGSEGDCLGHRGVEVCDLEVEVHHRALLPVDGRPHGGLVTGRLLEHDLDGSLGSGEDRRARLLGSGSQTSFLARSGCGRLHVSPAVWPCRRTAGP